jgi:hypothetical protein
MFLKHGTTIAGEWAVMGVLDALPDLDSSGDVTESGIAGAIGTGALEGPFGQMMRTLIPIMRPMLGRPFKAYGITPLLIFRKVTV